MELTIENYREILDQITHHSLTNDDLIKIKTRIENNRKALEDAKNKGSTTKDGAANDPSIKSTPIDKLTEIINTQSSKLSTMFKKK